MKFTDYSTIQELETLSVHDFMTALLSISMVILFILIFFFLHQKRRNTPLPYQCHLVIENPDCEPLALELIDNCVKKVRFINRKVEDQRIEYILNLQLKHHDYSFIKSLMAMKDVSSVTFMRYRKEEMDDES